MLTALTAHLLTLLLQIQTLGLCAACRQALEQSGQTGLQRGLGWSVVLLLSAPTFMVTAFTVMVVRSLRRQKALAAAQAAAAKSAAAAAPAAEPVAAPSVAPES